VRLVLATLFAFLVAAVLGLGGTYLALSQGTALGAVRIGAWTAFPKSGTTDIDPYARAVIARTGQLPVGSGDGVAFFARSDDNGRPLDGRCDVTVSGATPPARFWTLTLYDPDGRLIANSLNRYGFTSQEIVRRSDGTFDIAIAPRARAGNWLPTGGIDRYVLIMRFYDAPVAVATRTSREAPMPSITLGTCQ
jgi:hypothetical protein